MEVTPSSREKWSSARQRTRFTSKGLFTQPKVCCSFLARSWLGKRGRCALFLQIPILTNPDLQHSLSTFFIGLRVCSVAKRPIAYKPDA